MEVVDEIKVTDNKGFVYPVIIKHHPVIGVSIAYYLDQRIDQVEYGRMIPPFSDNDKEWEEWEERFREWADARICDLTISCVSYFNNRISNQ